MKIHELKIESRYFDAITNGWKTAELRKNDRDYQVGDILRLREICITKDKQMPIKYSGYYILVKIRDVLTHEEFEGLAEGYVMLSFVGLGEKKAVETTYDHIEDELRDY